MFRPSRRVAVGAMLALTVVAGASVAILTSGDGAPAGLAPVTDDAGLVNPTESTSPTPTPSDSPTPTPTPTPTATASAGATPSDEPRTASPTTAAAGGPITDYGPRPPGSVTVPYRAGQTSWDVTSNGIRVRVSMTPAKVGEPMTWTVSTSSSVSGCCVIYLLFGDGFGATPQMNCGDPDPHVSYSHVYNKAGRKEFMVQAGHSKSCGDSEDASVYGAFDVAPGVSTAQGPALPTVQFDNSSPVKGHENDPRYVSLYGEAEDRDGRITKLVVSFGDGTTKSFAGDTQPCQETGDGWPAGSRVWLPHDPPPYHRYSKPGTYTLTLTAYSAGCDGTQVQSGKKSFTWTVPEPEPTATPTASPTG